ncbi:MAG: hypothetical protein AABY49_08725 [Planctomycetota bacterium]
MSRLCESGLEDGSQAPWKDWKNKATLSVAKPGTEKPFDKDNKSSAQQSD